MQYLNRRGDIDETAKVKSVCIFNNWTETVPKFCFVVPTYKRARLLNYALNSILNLQGLSDFEILITDDNPEREDETEHLMLLQFCKPRIAYYKNERNLGQPGNWNKCILLSRAEWIIMLQDDDMLYPDFFHFLQKTMSHYGNEIGGYFPDVLQYAFDSDAVPVRQGEAKITSRIIKLEDFLQGNVLGAGALGMTLRREVALQIGGVNVNAGPAVDYDFYNRFTAEAPVVKLYGYPLGVWRTLVNVSQKNDTVYFCLSWGDIIMTDILEYLHRMWLYSLYKRYLRAYDRQHFANWCREMGKDMVADSRVAPATAIDKFVYSLFRLYFKGVRKLRSGSHNIA